MPDRPERCSAKSPGGPESPRKGTRCGLPEGHDGPHTILVPPQYPWAKQQPSPASSDRQRDK